MKRAPWQALPDQLQVPPQPSPQLDAIYHQEETLEMNLPEVHVQQPVIENSEGGRFNFLILLYILDLISPKRLY